MYDRLSQDKAGRPILAGHVLKDGDEVEVIVGGNWHRAHVHKNALWLELILDNSKFVAGVGLAARLPPVQMFNGNDDAAHLPVRSAPLPIQWAAAEIRRA